MNNDLTTLSDSELVRILGNSLYPGASADSIRLALGYCKAAGYDPMLKPCHIVPMWSSKLNKMQDVILPGIGMYRIIAARTGEYAGISEPIFGEIVTRSIGGIEITFPGYCTIVVRRRLGNGFIAEFSATEFWIENYAKKGGAERSVAPNDSWFKRPFGQIAKCTEAQALRKAFPEVGAVPTFEEIEGKGDDFLQIDGNKIGDFLQNDEQHDFPNYTDAKISANWDKWQSAVMSDKKTPDQIISMIKTKAFLTDVQIAKIKLLGMKNDNS